MTGALKGRHRSASPRCVRCRMQVHLCICPHLYPVPTETRVVVVIHAREHMKPSNSGHLARWLLPNAEVRVAGLDGRVAEPLEPDSDREAVVLFPRPGARRLDRPPDRPLTLVVPDAPWRQARRMANRWPGLAELPAVALPDGPGRGFFLRKSRHGPQALGTLESVARALGILECQFVEDHLLAAHARLVRHGLFARGRAPADATLRAQLIAAGRASRRRRPPSTVDR